MVKLLDLKRCEGLLAETPVTPAGVLPGSRHVYSSHAALLPAGAAPRRAHSISGVEAAGVETTIGTRRMSLVRCFRARNGVGPGDFPAAQQEQTAAALPALP